MDLKDFVLSRPTGEDMEVVSRALDNASEAIENYIADRDIEAIMRKFH